MAGLIGTNFDVESEMNQMSQTDDIENAKILFNKTAGVKFLNSRNKAKLVADARNICVESGSTICVAEAAGFIMRRSNIICSSNEENQRRLLLLLQSCFLCNSFILTFKHSCDGLLNQHASFIFKCSK